MAPVSSGHTTNCGLFYCAAPRCVCALMRESGHRWKRATTLLLLGLRLKETKVKRQRPATLWSQLCFCWSEVSDLLQNWDKRKTHFDFSVCSLHTEVKNWNPQKSNWSKVFQRCITSRSKTTVLGSSSLNYMRQQDHPKSLKMSPPTSPPSCSPLWPGKFHLLGVKTMFQTNSTVTENLTLRDQMYAQVKCGQSLNI